MTNILIFLAALMFSTVVTLAVLTLVDRKTWTPMTPQPVFQHNCRWFGGRIWAWTETDNPATSAIEFRLAPCPEAKAEKRKGVWGWRM